MKPAPTDPLPPQPPGSTRSRLRGERREAPRRLLRVPVCESGRQLSGEEIRTVDGASGSRSELRLACKASRKRSLLRPPDSNRPTLQQGASEGLRRRPWVAAPSRCSPWSTRTPQRLSAHRAGDRGVKPQRATSRGVGLKACLVDNRIRRSPTRDSRSSSLVQGTHRLGPGSVDIRQLSDIYPANESAAFARNMLIFFDSWLPEVGSNH